MQRIRVFFNYITSSRFCQYVAMVVLLIFASFFLAFGAVATEEKQNIEGDGEDKVSLSKEQEAAISDHCGTILESLKKVQRDDSRARVYLGGYYERILAKYITPLNIKLVEGNLSNADFVNNQNSFAARKTDFVDDFIEYQRRLEELVAIDCRVEPEKFYTELIGVRERRKTVEMDVLRIRDLMDVQIKLVEGLRGKLNEK